MVNIENINNKLSEIIAEEIAYNKFYTIKRFVINSIENVTVSKERGKFFNYYGCSGAPLMAFKLNVSFTIIRFTDDKEISLENVDFIWLADTVDDKGNYCCAYEEKLSKYVWDQEAPETRPDLDKMTKEYTLKLTDLYIENYFTHMRYTTQGRQYLFLYIFNQMIMNASFIKHIDSRNYTNGMLPADAQVICNLINQ